MSSRSRESTLANGEEASQALRYGGVGVEMEDRGCRWGTGPLGRTAGGGGGVERRQFVKGAEQAPEDNPSSAQGAVSRPSVL